MNSCDLQAVLVSSDPIVVDSVSTSLGKLGINAAVYRETSPAIQTLGRQKSDAFLVDRELDPNSRCSKRCGIQPQVAPP
jgi:hypothetical protein